MKKVKDSQKRWKQLVTMLLVAALLVTGTPDVVGFASEGTQEQVTAAAEQSQKTQEKAQKESVQEETAQKEAVQDHEQMSEEAGWTAEFIQSFRHSSERREYRKRKKCRRYDGAF